MSIGYTLAPHIHCQHGELQAPVIIVLLVRSFQFFCPQSTDPQLLFLFCHWSDCLLCYLQLKVWTRQSINVKIKCNISQRGCKAWRLGRPGTNSIAQWIVVKSKFVQFLFFEAFDLSHIDITFSLLSCKFPQVQQPLRYGKRVHLLLKGPKAVSSHCPTLQSIDPEMLRNKDSKGRHGFPLEREVELILWVDWGQWEWEQERWGQGRGVGRELRGSRKGCQMITQCLLIFIFIAIKFLL